VELDKFIKELTLRAGHSLIRYYLKEMHPETLADADWVDSILDIWLYRRLESKSEEK